MSDLILFIQERYTDLLNLVWEHLYISLVAVLSGFIVAVPLGILLTRKENLSKYVLSIANVIQTIPSLALLGFMIPLFGIGSFPAIVALFLYSLLPMLRNTYTGIKEVDPSLIGAAKGMGMTNMQVLFMVEIPLAIQVIIGGFRTATIYTISWATLAALIGGGGIGNFVFTGLNASNFSMLITGTIAAAVLAALADIFIRIFQNVMTPKGLRVRTGGKAK
jgi:osmoprotectant transport system permease protein